eukprot:comp23176_c1_seq1/m.37550 comp23176_c1_seq1/g.37550  ORF comp23176_c1_seq1/g.37550 comp23176_c1_seq1/m.37550 type:complete len:298 (-) comp23176_c1_seq1:28-921(-)
MSAAQVSQLTCACAQMVLSKPSTFRLEIEKPVDTQHIPSDDPDLAWNILSKTTVVKELPVPDPHTPQPPDTIRLVCISDTHGFVDKIYIPPGDILIHAGDFTNTGHPSDVEKFDAWMASLPHKHKLVIAGNHDLTFDEDAYPMLWDRFHKRCFDFRKTRALLKNCTYLEDSGVTIQGYKFWGSPWQPEFCNWAFNLKRGRHLKDKWDLIPSDTEILITHGPPVGFRDMIYTANRVGCVDLHMAVRNRIRPLYNIFGHIHEAYGMCTDGTTTYINASTCTMQYGPTNPAVIVDLPVKK